MKPALRWEEKEMAEEEEEGEMAGVEGRWQGRGEMAGLEGEMAGFEGPADPVPC